MGARYDRKTDLDGETMSWPHGTWLIVDCEKIQMRKIRQEMSLTRVRDPRRPMENGANAMAREL